MTLEHLIIVGTAQQKIITALSQGIIPPAAATPPASNHTADKAGDQQLTEYKTFLTTLRPSLDPLKAAALKSRARFPHPWMDNLNALQWQWLFGAHTHVHYQQVKEIVAHLSS